MVEMAPTRYLVGFFNLKITNSISFKSVFPISGRSLVKVHKCNLSRYHTCSTVPFLQNFPTFQSKFSGVIPFALIIPRITSFQSKIKQILFNQ